MAYARYKARILKNSKPKVASNDENEDSDEDNEQFYKSGTDEEDDNYHSANESDE